MSKKPPLFFALKQSANLGARIAGQFELDLSPHEEREFPDGEHKVRPLVEVFGRRVYVVHSLYSDSSQSVNDKLCRLLFFIAALRDAGVDFVTAVVPFMAYARKDKRTKRNDPVTTRYVANLFSSVRVDSVITLGVHNRAAQENAFQCLYRDLDAADLFADYFAPLVANEAVTVVAPDTGAVKGARRFQQALSERRVDAAFAFMTKTRSQDIVTSSHLFGDVKDRSAIVYDDLISSGTTIRNAAQNCRGLAKDIWVAATHGAFTEGAEDLLGFDALRRVVVSNSVISDRVDQQAWCKRLHVIDSSGLFVDFISRTVPD